MRFRRFRSKEATTLLQERTRASAKERVLVVDRATRWLKSDNARRTRESADVLCRAEALRKGLARRGRTRRRAERWLVPQELEVENYRDSPATEAGDGKAETVMMGW
jgi:hypothetical protein